MEVLHLRSLASLCRRYADIECDVESAAEVSRGLIEYYHPNLMQAEATSPREEELREKIDNHAVIRDMLEGLDAKQKKEPADLHFLRLGYFAARMAAAIGTAPLPPGVREAVESCMRAIIRTPDALTEYLSREAHPFDKEILARGLQELGV